MANFATVVRLRGPEARGATFFVRARATGPATGGVAGEITITAAQLGLDKIIAITRVAGFSAAAGPSVQIQATPVVAADKKSALLYATFTALAANTLIPVTNQSGVVVEIDAEGTL